MSNEIAVAKKPIRQVANVRELLVNDAAKQQLAAVAAENMKPERLMRITANAIRTTPKLQECEPLSFLGALMQCASLGLEANTVLGHAFLVPFDSNRKVNGKWIKVPEVQVIIGYKGLIDLARRSGHIRSISAHVHYSDDPVWRYREGADPVLEHEPGDQEGEKLHAYAVAHFREDRGGGFAHIVLPWKHVMRVRDGSQNWQSAVRLGKTEKSPWHTHEDAMAKKTAIRALAKYLPLSVEFRDAVSIDHDAGSRADFSAFAMNPTEGITIDGEVTEPEDETDAAGQQQDAAPEPEQKPAAAKPAQGGKKATPAKRDATPYAQQGQEAKAEPKGDGAEGAAEQQDDGEGQPADQDPEPEVTAIPDEFQSIIARVKGDLDEAKDSGEVEGTIELFEDPIEQVRAECPAAYDAIQEIADAARERVSGA